jgi:hypothetical protein
MMKPNHTPSKYSLSAPAPDPLKKSIRVVPAEPEPERYDYSSNLIECFSPPIAGVKRGVDGNRLDRVVHGDVSVSIQEGQEKKKQKEQENEYCLALEYQKTQLGAFVKAHGNPSTITFRAVPASNENKVVVIFNLQEEIKEKLLDPNFRRVEIIRFGEEGKHIVTRDGDTIRCDREYNGKLWEEDLVMNINVADEAAERTMNHILNLFNTDVDVDTVWTVEGERRKVDPDPYRPKEKPYQSPLENQGWARFHSSEPER